MMTMWTSNRRPVNIIPIMNREVHLHQGLINSDIYRHEQAKDDPIHLRYRLQKLPYRSQGYVTGQTVGEPVDASGYAGESEWAYVVFALVWEAFLIARLQVFFWAILGTHRVDDVCNKV